MPSCSKETVCEAILRGQKTQTEKKKARKPDSRISLEAWHNAIWVFGSDISCTLGLICNLGLWVISFIVSVVGNTSSIWRSSFPPSPALLPTQKQSALQQKFVSVCLFCVVAVCFWLKSSDVHACTCSVWKLFVTKSVKSHRCFLLLLLLLLFFSKKDRKAAELQTSTNYYRASKNAAPSWRTWVHQHPWQSVSVWVEISIFCTIKNTHKYLQQESMGCMGWGGGWGGEEGHVCVWRGGGS